MIAVTLEQRDPVELGRVAPSHAADPWGDNTGEPRAEQVDTVTHKPHRRERPPGRGPSW